MLRQQSVMAWVLAQVRDFWQDVEAATNERQRDMFQCINRQLESLSRQIEATVGEALDLRLEPVTIAMDPPAAQDFHESLQNLFAQGISMLLQKVIPALKLQSSVCQLKALKRIGCYSLDKDSHCVLESQYKLVLSSRAHVEAPAVPS